PIQLIDEPSFYFGLEYGVPNLAETYAETGLQSIKMTPALNKWGLIQPVKNAQYDFSLTDNHVREYQQAGFKYIQLLTYAESAWGSRSKTDYRPKKEFEEDYKKFIRALVERYDGDGYQDMPGLRYPINYWGVEREFTGYYPGTGSEYLELLRITYPEIKKANPNAKVMLNALLLWDVFQGNPSQTEIKNRFANPPGGKRKDLTDAGRLLNGHEYFDVIDFHSLSDYTEIDSTVKWLNEEMEKRGTNKEIYIGDAFPASPLLAYGVESCNSGLFSAKEFYPVTSKTRCEAANLIDALRKQSKQDHKNAVAWVEAHTSIGLTRKFVVAAGSGIKGINVGNLEDWFIPAGAGLASNFGLIDTIYGKGDQLVAKRTPQEKRPGFYAAKMVSKLQGFDSVEKLDWGENVWAYEFSLKNKRIIVAWLDDGEFYGLNAVYPKKTITLSRNSKAIITEIPTKNDTSEVSEVKSVDGKIVFELSYTPVFIE
ncbi:hypothetical protein HUU53_05060, partial [Candidatus Micrarchaeota archaeon]|nr:hypothetical protein [Candidatus Micrarchaeota archaeon]